MAEEEGAEDAGAQSTKPRWSITRAAKIVLEEVYRVERFPSAEMRRRLAVDFGVTPRQIQFWFQNRRQRESRKGVSMLSPVGDAATASTQAHSTAAGEQAGSGAAACSGLRPSPGCMPVSSACGMQSWPRVTPMATGVMPYAGVIPFMGVPGMMMATPTVAQPSQANGQPRVQAGIVSALMPGSMRPTGSLPDGAAVMQPQVVPALASVLPNASCLMSTACRPATALPFAAAGQPIATQPVGAAGSLLSAQYLQHVQNALGFARASSMRGDLVMPNQRAVAPGKPCGSEVQCSASEAQSSSDPLADAPIASAAVLEAPTMAVPTSAIVEASVDSSRACSGSQELGGNDVTSISQ